MDTKYIEILINKFEKSLSETERMSNSLIELSDVLSKLDTSISRVDESISNIYEDSEIDSLTEKSIDAVSSLQLVKKQSTDILKSINSFKTLQDDLCKVQSDVNKEYSNLIESNKEKLSIKNDIEEINREIIDMSTSIGGLYTQNQKLKEEVDNINDNIDNLIKTVEDGFIDLKNDLLKEIKILLKSESIKSVESARQIQFEDLNEDMKLENAKGIIKAKEETTNIEIEKESISIELEKHFDKNDEIEDNVEEIDIEIEEDEEVTKEKMDRATLYQMRGKDKEALEILKEFSDKGNATAQFQIGCIYYQGNSIKKNYKEAFKYFKLSAENENAEAMYSVGM